MKLIGLLKGMGLFGIRLSNDYPGLVVHINLDYEPIIDSKKKGGRND